MNQEELARFNEADKRIHPVETQWHYPIMTKYGFVPVTKTGIGFVRSYKYEHPTTKHVITCNTGYHADYWEDSYNKCCPLWKELEPYLERLKTQK